MNVETASQFAADQEALRRDLDSARKDLLQALARLSETDLERGRRGGWTIRRVLEHILDSERLYIAGMAHLQGHAAPSPPGGHPTSVDQWIEALTSTRAEILSLLDGASEETFYELRPLGHEEYSPISLLENVALHDREHAAQIGQILAES